MVITIEPGIYIPEENLGVRIEDDVLVTPTGYKLLTARLPRSPDEIEKIMAEGKPSRTGFRGCGKTRNESFRRAGFAQGICFFLGLAKKSRSLASLGMTKKHFFRSLFSRSLLRRN